VYHNSEDIIKLLQANSISAIP